MEAEIERTDRTGRPIVGARRDTQGGQTPVIIRSPRRLGALALAAAFAVGACSGSATPSPAASPSPGASAGASAAASAAANSASGAITYRCTKGDGQLNGAGSTFIFPLLSKMGADYNTNCGVKLNYQSIGSGGGVKQWTENTVDFGASDAFLADSEIQARRPTASRSRSPPRSGPSWSPTTSRACRPRSR